MTVPQDPGVPSAPPAGAVPTPWAAPTSGPVQATVSIPGSKSLTNRALVLAAQAAGVSIIGAPLVSRDTQLMATALQTLGTGIESIADADGAPDWRVTPAPLRGPATVDCGLAGTVMRFLPPLAATARGQITMDGDPQARVRPMGTVLDALRGLGVRIDGRSLPFTVHGDGPPAGGEVRIDASASSQFVSGLLLSGAGYRDGVTVIHTGPPVPSMPHIQMTLQALRSVGVRVDDSEPDRWAVVPGPVAPWTSVIEPDLSNASPFLAAAAIAGGTVHIPNWPAQTTQPGDDFRGILAAMGVLVTQVNGGISATGDRTIAAVDLDLHDVGELTPTVTALALFADGPSRLRGIAHLRGHETDRLAALVADIRALGGDADQTDDGLVVRPVPLYGGLWRAYADHRMATAGALVGLRVPGVLVDDIGTTGKTLPGFDRLWTALVSDMGSPPVVGGPS